MTYHVFKGHRRRPVGSPVKSFDHDFQAAEEFARLRAKLFGGEFVATQYDGKRHAVYFIVNG